MGRDVHTAAGTVGVAPRVVPTDQLGAVVAPDREANATVETAVRPDVDEPIIGSPHRQLPPVQGRAGDMARHRVLAVSDRKPGAHEAEISA